MENSNRPIDPENVAAKLRAMRNFQIPQLQADIEAEPRFAELLWVIVWASDPRNYPGGLERFCSDMVNECQNRIGTPTMLKAKPGSRYSEKDGRAIYAELPLYVTGGCSSDADFGALLARELLDDELEERRSVQEMAPGIFARNTDPAQLRARVLNEAKIALPGFFRELCESWEMCFSGRNVGGAGFRGGIEPWYWPNVLPDVLDWLDERSDRILQSIASTNVTREVMKWIRRARAMESPVWLTGSCRFGKTEAIRALSKAEPGRFRFVETPDDTSMLSLCRAIAEALGIVCNGDTALSLRTKIAVVLEESRLMLVFDEAHFLLPQKVTRYTRPQRLDFVRRVIVDRGLPAAFVSTPQSYQESRTRLERASGYSIGQWDGRLLREEPIELPEIISDEEAVAVAAVHLPGYSSIFHEAIAHRVMASRGSSIYAQTAKVCKMAFVLAAEQGRETLLFEDLEEAALITLPSLPEESAPEPSSRQRQRKPSARSVFPSRSVTPDEGSHLEQVA